MSSDFECAMSCVHQHQGTKEAETGGSGGHGGGVRAGGLCGGPRGVGAVSACFRGRGLTPCGGGGWVGTPVGVGLG